MDHHHEHHHDEGTTTTSDSCCDTETQAGSTGQHMMHHMMSVS